MRPSSRPLAIALLAAFALTSLGCESNNKGKIEGKWKLVSIPDNVKQGKDEMTEMAKAGVYVYMEFKPDGMAVFGVGADKQETLDFIKAAAPGQKTAWDLKYKLLPGDSVEFYDLPKDLREKVTGGLFGSKDRGRVTVRIAGNEMQMTDEDGTATLTKIPQ